MDIRMLAENFCAGYLWPDPEWVEFHDDGFSYWHGRLEQRFTVEMIDEEVCAWRMDIPLLTDIANANAAAAATLTLNQFAAGWSFWVDPTNKSLHALAAMTAPLAWNRWTIRFSEVAKLAAWYCEAAVEPLARHLNGIPLFSNPVDKPAPREVPDAVNYYPTAQRERPEWVLDPITGFFPSMEEIAQSFGERMEAPEVEADDSTLRIVQLAEEGGEESLWELIAGFSEHRLLGVGWRSELVLPQIPEEAVPTAALMATKAMWDAPGASLLGSWVDDEGVLVYRQWCMSSELRNHARLEHFDGTDDLLWSLTSPAADAAAWGQSLPEEADWPTITLNPQAEDDLLAEVFANFVTGSHPVFAAARPADSKADRSLLWLDRSAVLLVCGWFNPIGPTLSTVEVVTSPLDDQEQLLVYVRHPVLPEYRKVIDVSSAEQVVAALEDAVASMISVSPPNVVTMSGCPPELEPVLTAALRGALERLGKENPLSLTEERARVLSTLGDPWAFAGEERDENDGPPREVPPPSSDDEFAEWLAAVTDPENVIANMIQFGRAWDGSLNYLRSTGNLDRSTFDIGPMLLVYSDLGLVRQDVDEQPES